VPEATESLASFEPAGAGAEGAVESGAAGGKYVEVPEIPPQRVPRIDGFDPATGRWTSDTATFSPEQVAREKAREAAEAAREAARKAELAAESPEVKVARQAETGRPPAPQAATAEAAGAAEGEAAGKVAGSTVEKAVERAAAPAGEGLLEGALETGGRILSGAGKVAAVATSVPVQIALLAATTFESDSGRPQYADTPYVDPEEEKARDLTRSLHADIAAQRSNADWSGPPVPVQLDGHAEPEPAAHELPGPEH
jgi:hypothetical protein